MIANLCFLLLLAVSWLTVAVPTNTSPNLNALEKRYAGYGVITYPNNNSDPEDNSNGKHYATGDTNKCFPFGGDSFYIVHSTPGIWNAATWSSKDCGGDCCMFLSGLNAPLSTSQCVRIPFKTIKFSFGADSSGGCRDTEEQAAHEKCNNFDQDIWVK